MKIINGVPERKYRQLQELQNALHASLADHWYKTIYQERGKRIGLSIGTDYEDIDVELKERGYNGVKLETSQRHRHEIFIPVNSKNVKIAIPICLEAEERRHKNEMARLRKLW